MRGRAGGDSVTGGVNSGPGFHFWRRCRHLELVLVAAVILVDQTTKGLVRQYVPLHESIPVLGSVLSLTHVRNTGAAFGFLNAVDFPFKPIVIALVATLALIGIGFYAARMAPNERLARIGLVLIIGGAIGNLIDRLVLGSVVDFVDVAFGNWHFWAFNVADSAITLGVITMMIDMMGLTRYVSTSV
jgi:signal peptidase II